MHGKSIGRTVSILLYSLLDYAVMCTTNSCNSSPCATSIQTIKEMAHQAREQGDSALLCCAECILSCIESLVEYFNKCK